MGDIPKDIMRLLREQAAWAYAEELRLALLPLAGAFDEWKKGNVKSDKLCELIHEFHEGPSRELFARYSPKMFEPAVGYAIARGILNKNKIPSELLVHLKKWIDFYEEELKQS